MTLHLFGASHEPHLVHFYVRRDGTQVELGWEVRNAPALSWRVLRSEQSFADVADALPGSGQTVVLAGSDTHVTDEALAGGATYFYTVFAQDERGAWHRQVKARVAPHDRLRWHRGEAGVEQGRTAWEAKMLSLGQDPLFRK